MTSLSGQADAAELLTGFSAPPSMECGLRLNPSPAPWLQGLVFISKPSSASQESEERGPGLTRPHYPQLFHTDTTEGKGFSLLRKMERHDSTDPKSHSLLSFPTNSGLSGHQTELPDTGFHARNLILPDPEPTSLWEQSSFPP